MKMIVFVCEDSDGQELEIHLPTVFEVCERCQGNGVHCNPSIDGNGLSAEDFDEDQDFREDYFSGRYDVRCEDCHGERVMAVVDEAQADAGDLALYYAHLDEEAAYRRECAAERRMGA